MIAQNGVHLQWPTKQMPISDLDMFVLMNIWPTLNFYMAVK